MKSLFAIIITMSALVTVSAHSAEKFCTNAQVKEEARNFLYAYRVHHVYFAQDCIKKEIVRVMAENQKLDQKGAVLQALYELKQLEMSAFIKCESTNTPGCQPVKFKSDMSEEELLKDNQDW
jgi:hypothetical protein